MLSQIDEGFLVSDGHLSDVQPVRGRIAPGCLQGAAAEDLAIGGKQAVPEDREGRAVRREDRRAWDLPEDREDRGREDRWAVPWGLRCRLRNNRQQHQVRSRF